jgi:photosystem II stability/assembly factor-like uncharacterized protein
MSASGKSLYAAGDWLEEGELHSALFRSSDLGESWCVFSDLGGISEVAASPADDAHLYGIRTSGGGKAELAHSSDAGTTWRSAPLPAVNTPGVQPSLAAPEVVALSSPGGAPFLSQDGGESWEEIALPPEFETALYVLSATFDPADPRRILAGSIGDEGERLFATEDGGGTWRESNPPPNSFGIRAIHGTAGTTLFAGSATNLSVSTDWGKTWTESAPPLAGASLFPGSTAQAIYATAESGLWRSVDDSATFERVAGVPDRFEPILAGLPDADTVIGKVATTPLVTTDAGQSWSTRALVPAPYSLIESPLSPWPIWSSSPSSLSTDGGVSWVETTAELGQIIPDGRAARAAYYFSEKRGLRHTADGGKTWDSFNTPTNVAQIHGVATCAAPADCLYLLYAPTERPLEGSAYSTSLARSVDGGRTWEDPLPVREFYFPEVFQVAPDSADHLYVSGGPGLMETRDGGRSWIELDLPGAVGVASIAFLPGGVTLVASNNRGVPSDIVYRTEDGANWQPADVEPGRLFASHTHPGTVFLINGRVFRSDDSGATWARISPDTDSMFTSVADGSDGRFVAATELGLVAFE